MLTSLLTCTLTKQPQPLCNNNDTDKNNDNDNNIIPRFLPCFPFVSCATASGKGTYTKDQLDTNDVFIVETGNEVFVWTGSL